LVLFDLGSRLMLFGDVYLDLRGGFVANVDGGEVFLLRVVESLFGDDAVFGHLEGALVSVLEHGEIGSFGGYLVEFDGSGGGAVVGFGSGELGFLRGNLVKDFLLVELGEDFAGVDRLVDVGVQLGDDAAGFGFDLYLSDRPDFAGGDDRAGDVAYFDLAKLGRVDLGGGAHGFGGKDSTSDEDNGEDAEDDPKAFAGFASGGQRGLQKNAAEMSEGITCCDRDWFREA